MIKVSSDAGGMSWAWLELWCSGGGVDGVDGSAGGGVGGGDVAD